MTRSLPVYLIYFAFAYVGMLILFMIIGMLIPSVGSPGTVVAPFIAAMIVGSLFVKHEMRAPDQAERKTLTLGSFVIFIIINMALLGLAFVGGAFGDMSGAGPFFLIMGGFLLLICVLIFLMMRWAYGGLTQKRAEKLLGDQTSTFD